MSAPESLAPTGPPFPCPGCGATDEWRADYYVAVNQGATVVLTEKGPAVVDYSGDESSYDDGATGDEAIRCGGCGHEIVFGRYVFVEPFDIEALKAECGYHENYEDANAEADRGIDGLIDYKDALEGVVGRLIPSELWLAPTEGGPS